MFKNVLAPVQAWLISQGRCVGCGNNLPIPKGDKSGGESKVTCPKCNRVFVYDFSSKKYRRALFNEA